MTNLFINRKYRSSSDFDESFFVADHNKQSADSNARNAEFLGKYLSEKKINYFILLIFFSLGLLFLRSFYLQVYKGGYYRQIAEINRTRTKPLLAARGLIYDRQNRPLVKNIPFFDALIMPKDLSFNDKNRQEQIQQIASLLNIPANEIQNILSPYPKNFKYYVAAKENIDYEEALLLKIKSQGVSGLYIETRNEREYLFPYEFSHILGYEGKITEEELKEKSTSGYLLNDYLGKTGIELSYEDILRGKYGEEGIEVDVTGQAKKVLYHQDAQNGKNLILTIDWEVQKKIREILQNYLKQYNKSRASAIMLNPQKGEVIALVSLPDFDSNLFAGGISREEYKKLVENEDNPLFNRSIKGEYPSGSSIKPAIASAALQEKIVTDKTTFLSTGGLWLYDRWFFPDWSASGHGLTNIYKAIAWSVNTYFYIIGGGYNDFQGLGTDNLEKYLKAFGFGDKTGIDLAGESTGLVPTPIWKMKTKNEQWYIGDTYHLAIGQGDFLATPLQIANYTACIANGGTLYEPHLVKEIMPNQGDSEIIKPKILRDNFIDRENIDIVKRAMRQTVTIGSAQSLNNLSIAVAGKTGTAQWHPDKNNHAWFTGFAPYENPEVAITILVEEGGEGSSVSVPIAANILNWYFNEYQPKLK